MSGGVKEQRGRWYEGATGANNTAPAQSADGSAAGAGAGKKAIMELYGGQSAVAVAADESRAIGPFSAS